MSENNISISGAGSGTVYDAELCKALFDAADELRRLRPWDKFCEVDVFEIYPSRITALLRECLRKRSACLYIKATWAL